MSFTVSGGFFKDFYLSDNVIYNLSILRELYYFYNNSQRETRNLLIKPIILFLVSVIEAILYDFHKRMKINIYEGVPGIEPDVLDYIRGKDLEKFSLLIESSRRHNLFETYGTKFYDKLDDLRKIRDRIHIQNTHSYEPIKEYDDLFNDKNKVFAEICLEQVVKKMQKRLRPVKTRVYAGVLEFPWDEHLV